MLEDFLNALHAVCGGLFNSANPHNVYVEEVVGVAGIVEERSHENG
jgi:hypothetical protein